MMFISRKLHDKEVREAYLRGLDAGRREAPMTCGIPQRDHCPHDYIYDPGC